MVAQKMRLSIFVQKMKYSFFVQNGIQMIIIHFQQVSRYAK